MLSTDQKRATILIQKLSYAMCLRECRLATLDTRELRGDQIEVFKILIEIFLTSY